MIAPMATVTIREVTCENWRAALGLSVHPEQQRFVADHTPIAAIALAKAYVQAGGLVWEPYAIYAGAGMVGFVELAYEPSSADHCWVYHFFIDQAQQGKGYGKAGLRALIRLVQERHPACRRINLAVHPENRRAQRLYTSAEFEPTNQELDGEPVYTLSLE